MKRLFIVTAIGTLVLFTLWFYWNHPLQTTVTIRNATFVVDLAVTNKEKEKGLGGRDSLSPNHGMLFVYDQKARFPYWMKDMRFPIDIIWIDGKTVADITKNVPVSKAPAPMLPIYHPRVPVDKVLEIGAGRADMYGIAVGDTVKIKN